MAKSINRPSFWIFCLCALAAFAILISLGNWQVRRLAWKEQLIADVNSRVASQPITAPGPKEWDKVTRSSHVYQPVTVSGHYDHSREVHVWFALGKPQGGTYAGPGYFILTPFRTAAGWDVIVNRGFVPDPLKEPTSRPDTLVTGELTLTGLMRFDEPKNWNSPAADKVKNVWIVRQVSEMAAYLGLSKEQTAPYWVDLTKGQGVDGLPQGGETRITFTNSHLQYALTWFGLAGVLVLVFGVWLVRTVRATPSRAEPESE
ncbi:SURF1 family protein [Cohaesibacter sp. CAU 1516]|uniref:SURF1 family protein n=1 Tax=Cohaesibacter sp. CAU 1516 TaxID=2576038 RepID=UPI0010FD9573|nr:SURF1 family protein [Cohaesibacter sp. CAU 1516]TLP45662.1 SURF1 family protein [Cohaesibacter sp. CAU 1516]